MEPLRPGIARRKPDPQRSNQAARVVGKNGYALRFCSTHSLDHTAIPLRPVNESGLEGDVAALASESAVRRGGKAI